MLHGQGHDGGAEVADEGFGEHHLLKLSISYPDLLLDKSRVPGKEA